MKIIFWSMVVLGAFVFLAIMDSGGKPPRGG